MRARLVAAAWLLGIAGDMPPARADDLRNSWGDGWGSAASSLIVDLDDSDAYPVAERPRPDYDPVGLHAGGMLWLASAATRVVLDDNVLAATRDAQHDTFALSEARMRGIAGHADRWLTADLGVARLDYWRLDSEDAELGHAALGGGFTVAPGVRLRGKAQIAREVESRAAADAPRDAARPVPFSVMRAELAADAQLAHGTTTTALRYDSADFDDVAAIGGVRIDQDARDIETVAVSQRLATALTPSLHLFALGEANMRNRRADGVARDSAGVRLLAGIDYRVTSLIGAEFGIGHLVKRYGDGLADASAPAYRGMLTWQPTRLLTLRGSADRVVEDASFLDTAARQTSSLALAADYEWRRNVIISPRAALTEYDYLGGARLDEERRYAIETRYLANRAMEFTFTYDWTDRASTLPAESYTRGQIGAGLRVAF